MRPQPAPLADRTADRWSNAEGSDDDHEPAQCDRRGYEVGYGKPPKHSQFRPGQSGNPAGRRKGVRNLETDVKRTLKVPVKVKEGGRSRKISTQEGALMVLREKALKAMRARSIVFLSSLRVSTTMPSETGPAQPLSADDQAILAPMRPKSRLRLAQRARQQAAKPLAIGQQTADPIAERSRNMNDAAVLAALLRSDLRFFRPEVLPDHSAGHALSAELAY